MAGSSNDFSRGGDISRGDSFSWLKISVVAIWKYRVKGSFNLRSETSPVCVLFFREYWKGGSFFVFSLLVPWGHDLWLYFHENTKTRDKSFAGVSTQSELYLMFYILLCFLCGVREGNHMDKPTNAKV